MTLGLFTPRALAELDSAAEWIAAENQRAAETLLTSAIAASRLLAGRPAIGRQRTDLLPGKYRLWSLRGFPYLLVYNAEVNPIRIVRFVHMARDLPAELREFEQ